MSSTFRPETPPKDFTPEQQGWLRKVQSAIKDAWEAEKPHETLQVLHAEPSRLKAGMLVNADGSDWNPGNGAGLYLRDEGNATWIFLGEVASVQTEDTTTTVLETLVAIQTEQLVQLTKIACILSQMTGIDVPDDLPLQSGQLQQLTSIALILSSMSGNSVDDGFQFIQ